jgi:hypothetical protein
MNFLFIILCIIHIFIWAFVLLAFLNPKTAYYNVYYVIPIIYIVHILPFHIIVSLKKKIYTDDNEEIEKESTVSKFLIIPYLFNNAQKFFKKYSFCSPLSPQGMLIFGLLTSIYRLKQKKCVI